MGNFVVVLLRGFCSAVRITCVLYIYMYNLYFEVLKI